MRAMEATVLRLLVSSLAGALACHGNPRAAQRPADAGTLVTVYVPSRAADRIMGLLQNVAARHQWVLSVRTDSAALAEADLIVRDSAGALIGRVRPGAAAAAQAQQMADAALR